VGSVAKTVTGFALGGVAGAGLANMIGGGGPTGANSAQEGAREQLSDEAYRQKQMLVGVQEKQKDFAQQLADRALGKTPSVAEMQMKAAQDRSIAQQIAMAKANRSANPGLMARTQANNAAAQAQQVNQAAAAARLLEQQQNQQMFGNYLGQQQQNFLGLATSQANAANNVASANLQAQQNQNQLMGGMMQAGATVLAAPAVLSDKKEKKEIKSGKKDSKNFLDALSSHSYKYKNPEKPGAGEGEHLSVMAQDLEKAGPVGRSMVTQAPTGEKMVDYGRGFGAILAAQADLNERLNQIESKYKKTKKG
jgi:hypothetical protein